MATSEIQSRLLLLAKEIEGGNKASQTEFYKLLKTCFFNLCRKYTNTEYDAEEAFQNACIKISSNLSQYNGSGNFYGWLGRIFINHAITEDRRVKLDLIGLDYDDEVPDYFEEPEFFGSDELRKTRDLYNNLDKVNKTIVYMRIEDDMTFNEIAKALNISRVTACRRYNNIIKQIKKVNNID